MLVVPQEEVLGAELGVGNARGMRLLHGEDGLVLVELVGDSALVEQRDRLRFAVRVQKCLSLLHVSARACG